MARVAFFQPCIPHYRVPFFNALVRRHGFDVTVFSGDLEAGMTFGGDEHFDVRQSTVRAHKWSGSALCSQDAMLDAAELSRFDAVVYSWNTRYLSLLRALFSRVCPQIPVLLWGHGYSKRKGWVRDWLRNHYARLADGVVLYDQRTREYLIQRCGFDSQSTFVAPNALDQSSILAARKYWLTGDRLSCFQAEQGLNPARTLCFVSRLLPENRSDDLLKAMSLLRSDFDDLRLVVIGDGPDRSRLEQLVRDSNLDDSVIFTGAIYNETDIAPWMLSSAFFPYPVNMGLSLLHAFGYGLPVVTGDKLTSHGPEIAALRSGENGLFFPHGNVDAMSETWRQLLECPDEREEMSVAALRTVADEFTIDRMAEGFAAAISVCCGRKSALSRAA